MKIKATKLNTSLLLAFFCLSILISGCKKASDYQDDQDDFSCETFLECQNATLWVGDGDDADPSAYSFKNNLNNPYDGYEYVSPEDDCWERTSYGENGNFQIIENSKNLLKISFEVEFYYVIQTFTITNDTLSVLFEAYSYSDDTILSSYNFTYTKSTLEVDSITICDD